MISSKFCKLLLVRICLQQKFFFAQNLSKHVVLKLQAYNKCPFSNCSDLIASHCISSIINRLEIFLLCKKVFQRDFIKKVFKFKVVFLYKNSICTNNIYFVIIRNIYVKVKKYRASRKTFPCVKSNFKSFCFLFYFIANLNFLE